MQRTRGLSMAVTAALLILVAIAMVAALWLYGSRFTSGGAVVQASANLITNRWVGNKPVYVIDISLQSKAQTRLYLKQVNVIATKKDGNTVTGSFTYNRGWQGNGVTGSISPNTQIIVEPNSNYHITISLTGDSGNPFVEISFQLVFQDDAGNTYTVQTNSVQVG